MQRMYSTAGINATRPLRRRTRLHYAPCVSDSRLPHAIFPAFKCYGPTQWRMLGQLWRVRSICGLNACFPRHLCV